MVIFYIGYLIVLCLALIGYIMNVVKLLTTTLPVSEWAALEVIRAIGLFFPPIGAIVGWI